MDLLAGYGSDDSSEDEGEAPTTAASKPVVAAVAMVGPAPITKRGKKLVSLHAVLPPQILEQLTASNVGNASDEEDQPGPTAATVAKRDSANTHHKYHGADDGLSSLLSELGSVPTKGNPQAPQKPEKMGQAFMHTTTVIKKQADKAVVDIHAPKVETIDENDENEEDPEHLAKQATRRPNVNAAPSNRAQQQQDIRAPPHQNSVPTLPPQPPETYQQASYPLEGDVEPANDHVARKRSRKEIEKALRSGNLAAIDNYDDIQKLNAESIVYVPQEETFMAPKGSGIRVAPVAMYDTKAGKDILGASVSGKARGKNQINALMASAAAFQANQLQQQKVKSHRADAKRKYGW
jgi:hypothetical protein